ncbi:unnamed protein product [Trifolium pratense]|uniref:Uncharacterized protein n=1 Tax=Trifolium pratense TaxID=57577 RepID=A0ACB0M0W7_TRIPR|nr:unnamed protein product [Trifolium pratense]
MGDIDPSFIQSTEHRPKLSTFVEFDHEIPIIDLSEKSQQNLISKIGKACEEWGFFQVTNHGVPSEVSTKVEIEAKKFFEDWKEVFDYLVENTTQVPFSHKPHDLELRTLTNQWPQHNTLIILGLQVKRKSVGHWIPVKPTPGAFIINVGDIVQVWSNDKYESVEHMAVANTKRERFSIPLFFFPGDLDEQREVFMLTKEKSSWAASQLDLAPRSERGFPQ